MNKKKNLAIVGSGATALYLLKHLLDNISILSRELGDISIFEKGEILGMGMPYHPQTTDIYNLSNIASEEIPDLPISFAGWLRLQSEKTREELGLAKETISESAIYNRLSLGRYFRDQFQSITQQIQEKGILVRLFPQTPITDIKALPDQAVLFDHKHSRYEVDKVIIASGHSWQEADQPEAGYYASPWPIFKILPEPNTYYNFSVGTLGASLSAFDVISSLFHRHGTFEQKEDEWVYHPHPGAEDFKVIMHAEYGWLPHLQYEQEEPMREIYRHIDRKGLLQLLNEDGLLRLDSFFDKVCRPALMKAFAKDDQLKMKRKLSDTAYGLVDFIDDMTSQHEYKDAFAGMRSECSEARESAQDDKPIHWKEVMDDLMYCLNYHAELMPAEDHLLFHSAVMPFLMNVIAALPLPSAKILLALYDAGKIDIVKGKINLEELRTEKGKTTIEITDGDQKQIMDYPMFIICGGQKSIGIEDYPFPGLVQQGAVRKARAIFQDPEKECGLPDKDKKDRTVTIGAQKYYYTGGIDIDARYRVIGQDGKPSDLIHDISFPHTSGIRPYSYGLQACSTTARILVESWVASLRENSVSTSDITEVAKV